MNSFKLPEGKVHSIGIADQSNQFVELMDGSDGNYGVRFNNEKLRALSPTHYDILKFFIKAELAPAEIMAAFDKMIDSYHIDYRYLSDDTVVITANTSLPGEYWIRNTLGDTIYLSELQYNQLLDFFDNLGWVAIEELNSYLIEIGSVSFRIKSHPQHHQEA